MKKFLKIFFFVLFFVFSFSQSNFAKNNIIKIGVLIDLSGPLSTFGHQILDGLRLAKTDIEKYFQKQNYPYKIKFYIEDTQLNPSICLKKLQVLKTKDINVIIGPISSGELKNIKSYAHFNKIVIFSYSTAIPYMIGFVYPEEKKYIFRIVPNDSFQGKVIALLLKDLQVKNVLIIYRTDPWGKGLKNAVIKNLKNTKLISEIGYPSTPEPSDWSPYIQKMENLLKGKSPKDTAILAIGFEELATLLSQISDNSPLLSYKWFGSDGIVNSQKVIEEAKEKAVKIKLYSTIFYSKSESAERLKKFYRKEIPQYVLNSYDALWISAVPYAEILVKYDKFDPDRYVKMVKKGVKNYTQGKYGVFPVTGKIEFNNWNDRNKGNYGIYIVTPEGWKLAGIWDCESGKIFWGNKE